MSNPSPMSAAIWSMFERLSTQIVSFVMGMVLARLLSPADYGTIGLITIFISLSEVFVDCGFANALIRKIDREQNDLSTAFVFNIGIGIVAYTILCLISPFVASFFEEPILIPLLKIVGLNVVINSLSVVQIAILTSNLEIRKQTFINLCGQIPAGLLAIFLAYRGMGVYAIAVQSVSAAFIKMMILWIVAKWRPVLMFSKQSFRYLWGFGSKLLAANLIGTLFNEIYSVLIGKYVGKTDLGYYSKASQLNVQVNSISVGIIQKISLPVLSKYQNDKMLLCDHFREIMRLLVLLISPISAFLCFASKDIISIIWTDKWLFSAELFSLVVMGSIWRPISSLSLSLMQVVGKTGLILKLELPKKSIYCVLIAIGFAFGIKGLVISQIFINIVAALINMFPTKKILGYSYVNQLVDVLKYMIISFVLAWVVSLFARTNSYYINVCLIFIPFFFLYFTSLWIIKDVVFIKYFKKVRSKIMK